MSEKPEALRLAEQLAEFDNHNSTDAIAYRASEELERLHAECEALRADAGRYRWLRAGQDDWEILHHRPGWATSYGRNGLDAAIDAAMGKT